jgi:AsmA family/AsmA-like C-terminal region
MAAHLQDRSVSFPSSKRGVRWLTVLLLLSLFLIRPGANRMKARIVRSISLALGRPVEAASVRVRLLPQPGFELENFLVRDDRAFGEEPMLRAQEVTASLRLISLLRGRLEIARLSLTEPSLNLVRNRESHWNLESLIERAARVSVAPTSKSRAESRPGFPYIEGRHGRINFKVGPEKKPYAFTEADFALWQESENMWGMRFEAHPVRTDFNLTDTGVVRANGWWQRAVSLPGTPLEVSADWEGAQLGQATKLFYGSDKGWRGTLKASLNLMGTPQNSVLVVSASAEDFRRYDVFGGGKLRLAAQCNARFHSGDNALSDISCRAPVGEGALTLRGSIAHPWASPAYDLLLAAENLPTQSLVALAGHSKSGVPDDLQASGQLEGRLRGLRKAGISSWEGEGQVSQLQLQSGNKEIAIGEVPFAIASPSAPREQIETRAASPQTAPQPAALMIGPIHVAMGRPVPLMVEGRVGREGYEFIFRGDAQVERLFETARMLRFSVPPVKAQGLAKIDLVLRGEWWGPEPPHAVGKAQLVAIRSQVRGLNAPLDIVSANLALAPNKVQVQNLLASVAGSIWTGSLLAMRPCSLSTGCRARFDLHVDDLAIERMNQLLNPQMPKKPWYRVLTSPADLPPPFLATVIAEGKLAVDRMLLDRLEARRIKAKAELNQGRLRLSDLQAEVLGGQHRGEWNLDFMAKPPRYEGSGNLEDVVLDQLGEMMNDGWITGSANASYQASIAGLSSQELLDSATGTIELDASAGELRHIVLTDGGAPLRMRRLTARLLLDKGTFEIEDGKLDTASEIFRIRGTASLEQMLNLKLIRGGASGFNIVGPLARPHVSPFVGQETRAALKP